MPLTSTLVCWVRLALFRCARNLLHHPHHQDARSQFLADMHDPANAQRPFFLRRYRRSAKSKTPDALVLPGTWRFAEMLWCSYGVEAPGLVLGVISAAGALLLLLRAFLSFATHTRFTPSMLISVTDPPCFCFCFVLFCLPLGTAHTGSRGSCCTRTTWWRSTWRAGAGRRTCGCAGR